MARWITPLATAFGLAVMTGSVAFACSPPPQPDWSGWDEDPATDIFVGRVESLTALPETEIEGIPVKRGRLRIARLDLDDGRTGPSVMDATIVVEVLDSSRDAAASALCLHPESYRTGDILLVMQQPGARPRLFSRTWAGQSRFAALFEAIQDPRR